MIDRIRARGFTVRLTEAGALWRELPDPMSPAQRKYVIDHESELVAELWAEDGASVCRRCQAAFDCHQEGEYSAFTDGILCRACVQYRDKALAEVAAETEAA